jgi:hypothetical protein
MVELLDSAVASCAAVWIVKPPPGHSPPGQ